MSLSNFQPDKEFLVGIDSDGCAFDTMEIKQKECFIPNFINHYNLQAVSKYAREASEFTNLYSKDRGINRFPGLVVELDWLRRRPEVQARKVEIPRPEGLIAWIDSETKLGNPALIRAVESNPHPDLVQALEWSEAVNASVTQLVRNVPPFPFVQECLDKLAPKSDLLVVSATPNEALQREWEEHDISGYVRAICGQEVGTKKETLGVANHYPAPNRLMIGDALGDHAAALANEALFFPINPGGEEASWERLFEEGIDRFLAGTFAGAYQSELLAEFKSFLPESPPWPVN